VDGELKVGVLALQGGFALHIEKLQACGVKAIEVRYADQIFQCDGLILPGGESTVISKLAFQNSILLKEYQKPIFGTCAGLILMSKWGLLDVEVERNAYGRQVASFQTTLELPNGPAESIFIRAPKIVSILSKEVKVLARFNQEPVFVRQGHCLGASFHPELSPCDAIHRYFIGVCHEFAREKGQRECSRKSCLQSLS
jgi:5'-phosphate synthase pdxT subunit